MSHNRTHDGRPERFHDDDGNGDSDDYGLERVTADLRAKHAARNNNNAVTTASHHRHDYHDDDYVTRSGYNSTIASSSLDDHVKMELAVLTSQASFAASLPGITMHSNHQGSRNSARSKPSQEQIARMGDLRIVQKNRRSADHREEAGPEPTPANEELAIRDFQMRMHSFREIHNEQARRMDQEKKRKRRMKNGGCMLLVAAVMIISLTIGAVWGVRFKSSSSPAKDDDNNDGATIRSIDECLLTTDITQQSSIFRTLRSALFKSVARPPNNLTLDVDIAGSNQRGALCWLSEVDGFSVDSLYESEDYQLVQRFALASIYRSLHATFALEAESEWMTPSLSVCDWNYVSCEGPDKGVTMLELVNTGFVPISTETSIPTELGLLSDHLVILRLSNTALTGSIPSQVSSLTNLETLTFTEAKLSGEIPSFLASMTQLTAINLFQNRFTGTIPPDLLTLPRLTFLDLSENLIEGSLPIELGNATSLERLSVELNPALRGPIPNLSKLSNLKQILLTGMLLDGSIPDVSHCPKLEALHLKDTSCNGTIPSYIWYLQNLTELDLGATDISGTLPVEAVQLSKLETLSLRLTRMRGSIPSTFGKLTMLKYLELTELAITGIIPTELGLLTNLVELFLSSTFEGSVPEQVCGLFDTSLQRLGGPCGDKCSCCNSC